MRKLYVIMLSTLLFVFLSSVSTLKAGILKSYDRESLIYMSGHVVEDVIEKSSKQNNYEVWDVEVAGVCKGALTA